MKICFIIRGWPSKSKPQLGIFERDQVMALSKLGHKIVVLCVDLRYRPVLKKIGIEKSIEEGFPVYRVCVHSLFYAKIFQRVSISLYQKVIDPIFLHYFKKVIAEEGTPDILYAHYLPFSAMALSAKRKYNVPVVGMEHWSELGYEKIRKRIKEWANYTYKELDCLLTVSTDLKENIKKNFGIDSLVVNNMLGIEFLKGYEKNGNDEDHKIKYVAVGNLVPRKGFDLLISAFHKAKLPNKKWSLSIVGGGDDYDLLQTMIHKYDLQNNIHLLGAKNRKEVVEILRTSNVFVLSSYSETFGVVSIEALSCGLPVIATKCCGTTDYMSRTNGIVCPIGDCDKMSEAIQYMFLHYTEYDRKLISDNCLNKFSPDAISNQLDKLFKEIINKTK